MTKNIRSMGELWTVDGVRGVSSRKFELRRHSIRIWGVKTPLSESKEESAREERATYRSPNPRERGWVQP